jgi:hypothetical protein
VKKFYSGKTNRYESRVQHPHNFKKTGEKGRKKELFRERTGVEKLT